MCVGVSANLGPLRFPSKSLPPGTADAHYFFIVVCGPRSRNSCPKIVCRLCAPVKGFHTGLRCGVYKTQRIADNQTAAEVGRFVSSVTSQMSNGHWSLRMTDHRAKTRFSVNSSLYRQKYFFIFIFAQLANGSESSPSVLGESRKSK